MGWWARITARIREALTGGGWSASLDADEVGYRRLTGRAGPRDLDPLSQEQMLRVCRWLYDLHPMGGWMIDHRVGLICGDELGFSVEVDATAAGLTYEEATALERRIKARLEMFWHSPVFSLRTRADELFTSYLVDGELCLPLAAGNPIDGLPQIDMIDVAEIKTVEMAPGSGLIADTVVLVPKTPGGEDRRLRIVRLNPATGRLEGECFFFRYSRLANAVRGRSDLLRQADWLDVYDQILFGRADKVALLNALVWDLTIKGGTPEAVQKRADEFRKHPPTKPGTTYVHNDQEELKAVTPSLQAEDASTEAKHLQNFILGSKSIPESWFSGGGEVTRTTAGEQNDVALMVLRRDRKQVAAMFAMLLHYAYDQLSATQPQLYPARATGIAIKPDLPPLDEKDISRLGGVVQNVVAALAQGIADGLISRDTARKVLLHFVDRLGVPVDPDTEKQTIERERQTDVLTQAALAQRMAAQALDGREPADDDEDKEDAA